MMCGCGSGLRALRCCALDLQQIPQATAAAHLLPLIERAWQAHGQGGTALAEQLCLDVLELAPQILEGKVRGRIVLEVE